MILGALAAAGVDRDELIRQLSALNVPDFDIDFTTVDRSGISSVHAEVKVPQEHAHRHLHHIEKIINDSALSESVKTRAIAIFTRLAEAEAKVHGTEVQNIHFHEVGAMDAIVDVVGACVGFEMLGVERFACSKIHVGSGVVNMAHGKFPVPPPAVAEILKGTPIYSTEIEGELMTPTGAAIIATVCESYGTIPELKGEVIGYGAGTREYKDFPNTLRVVIGESDPQRHGSIENAPNSERLTLLETNLDDLSPQVLGYVLGLAFEIGALDCWFTPIQMKKNRPAVMLSVLCRPEDRTAISEMIYQETTTLGIRVRETERECLEREIVQVNTPFGPVDVKLGRLGERIMNAMPEYDQVKRIASENGVPFRAVRDAALAAIEKETKAAVA
jgi:uncharacterized protein (TIGR00299 family) protein